MKKRRVLALVHETLMPPESLNGLSDEQYRKSPWKCEFDVISALKDMNCPVRTLGVYSDLGVIRRAVEEWKPHIVFNLLEEWNTVSLYDQNIVVYLELLEQCYTGCNPRGLMLARDKAISKKLLAYHRIRVPDFVIYPVGRRVRRPARLAFPLFVKSLTEDASIGISQASLVRDDKALVERVRFIHQHTGNDAMAEQYIEGRELYIGVLGNQRLIVFPIWELVFANKPDGAPIIATARAKWNIEYQRKWGVASREAHDLPPWTAERLDLLARRIYRVLCLSGYARLDFRLTHDGDIHFLEANPNPQLARGEDFADAAEKKGISYEDLLGRIINAGLSYRPTRFL